MKKTSHNLSLTFFLVAAACSPLLNEDRSAEHSISTEDEIGLVSLVSGERFTPNTVRMDRLAVKLNEETVRRLEQGGKADFLPQGSSLEKMFPTEEKYLSRHRASGLDRWYYAILPGGQNIAEAELSLSQCSDIESVEPVRFCVSTDRGKFVDISYGTKAAMSLADESYPYNDPELSRQWHYFNDGSKSGMVEGSDINIFPVWRQYGAGAGNVVVAVVDGGIDYTHPDLADNIWTGENGEHGKNFVVGGPGDFGDHGTHVAGTIAAVNNNSIGVCGIAGGDADRGIKGAQLMSCWIFDGNKSGSGAEAIVWAADHGAVIAQNSWGYNYDYNNDGKVTGDELRDASRAVIPGSLKDAIDYFNTYAGCDENGQQLSSSPMKGGIVIFAAGNDEIQYNCICAYDGVLSVASIGADYQRAYYSNFASWVDVTATGGDAAKGYYVRSTICAGKYAGYQGTSMACPHVSGLAALLLGQFGGAGFTREQLFSMITSSTNDKLYDYNQGYIGELGSGMIDSFAAFGLNAGEPGAVEGFEGSVLGNSIDLNWTFSSTGSKPYAYRIYYSLSSLEGLDTNSVPEGVSLVTFKPDAGSESGETIDYKLSGLDFSKTYYIRMCSVNYLDKTSALTPQIVLMTGENHPPVIQALDGTELSLKSHESGSLRFAFSDEDGHELSYRVETSVSGGRLSGLETIEQDGVLTFEIDALKADEGKTYSGRLIVSDTYSESVIDFSYTILANNAPEYVSGLDNIVFNSKSESVKFRLSDCFADKDGENLKYSAECLSLNQVVKLSIEDDEITIKPVVYGSTELSFKALDARGRCAERTVSVLVRDGSFSHDLYPNPVVDILNIRSSSSQECQIRISDRTGRLRFSSDAAIGPFEPLKVDMSSFESGAYYVEIKPSGAESFKYTVVKE